MDLKLRHNKFQTSLSAKKQLEKIYANCNEELELAVSKTFWDEDCFYDEYEGNESEDYGEYFKQSVVAFSNILGKPVFEGACTTLDFVVWKSRCCPTKHTDYLVVWENATNKKIYIRNGWPDKEAEITIALGCAEPENDLKLKLNPAASTTGGTNVIRYDGVYGGSEEKLGNSSLSCRRYLRFYPEGDVISCSVTGVANPEVMQKWFKKEEGGLSRGKVMLTGNYISFTTICPEEFAVGFDGEIKGVEYNGEVKDDQIALAIFSQITQYRHSDVYEFVEWQEKNNSTSKPSC